MDRQQPLYRRFFRLHRLVDVLTSRSRRLIFSRTGGGLFGLDISSMAGVITVNRALFLQILERGSLTRVVSHRTHLISPTSTTLPRAIKAPS